jgi:hypothetical protein
VTENSTISIGWSYNSELRPPTSSGPNEPRAHHLGCPMAGLESTTATTAAMLLCLGIGDYAKVMGAEALPIADRIFLRLRVPKAFRVDDVRNHLSLRNNRASVVCPDGLDVFAYDMERAIAILGCATLLEAMRT